MRKSIYLIFLLISPILLAQTNVDSLVHTLKTKELPVEKQLLLYEQISNSYSRENPEKGISYGKEGLLLAEKEKNKNMIARFCITIGNSFTTISSFDSSMIYLNKAMDYAKEIGDKKVEAAATAETGLCYVSQHKYEEGIEYYLKSLPLYESVGDKANYTRILLNIGGIHGNLNQNERSLYYLKQAQVHVEGVDHPILKIAVYELLGSYYLRTKDFENALENMLIAYELSHKYNVTIYIITTTQFLAGIYTDGFKDYKKAEKYALECVKTAEAINSRDYLIVAWNILAKVFIGMDRFDEGKDISLKAWQMDSTTIQTATSTAYHLAVCYLHTGPKEKALYYFDKRDNFRMEQFEKQFHDSVSDMEVKYETEKKEDRIVVLEKEQKLYTWLGSITVVALLLGIGLLFYRHRLAVQKHMLTAQQVKQLEQEKELIATRSALEAEKSEREIIARDLHDGVGAMLSVVKNNMTIMKSYSIIESVDADCLNKTLDVLNKSIAELRRVAHHIMPDTLINKGLAVALDDFCRSIPEVEFHSTESNRRFDTEKELILYRCTYELINNALRHAKASQIDVHLNMDEKTVYLSVVDNGCGFDPQTVSAGMGINNLRTRLSVFSGRMDIYSGQGNGTEVNVELDL